MTRVSNCFPNYESEILQVHTPWYRQTLFLALYGLRFARSVVTDHRVLQFTSPLLQSSIWNNDYIRKQSIEGVAPLISSVGFLASYLLGWEQGQRGKKRLLSISDVGDGSSPEIDPYALNQQRSVTFFSSIFFQFCWQQTTNWHLTLNIFLKLISTLTHISRREFRVGLFY